MLAVQRPSMGSSKPPNQDLPFGYDFGDSTGYPFPSPPAPAPGPSLLNDNENKFLDGFFSNLETTTDFGIFGDNHDGLDGMGYNWNEPPPTFVGSSTSFGQQPAFLGDMQNMTYPDMNGHVVSQNQAQNHALPQSNSADVLAAAALLHNGQNGRSHSMSNDPMFVVPNALSGQQQRSQSASQMLPFGVTAQPNETLMHNSYFQEMMFGPPEGRRLPKGPPKSLDIQWGSDAGFGSAQGFVAPHGQETLETVEQEKLRALDCLEPHSSTAASTRPSSPVTTRRPESMQQLSQNAQDAVDIEAEDEAARSKKRRKSEMRKDADGEVETNGKHPKKKRPKSMAAISSTPLQTSQSPPSKRRKSIASSAAKPPRENLTEDQKRENHIRSEQKRRTLIKEGFDDLGELVPDLRSGGFSKSAVLVMTADFLEDLIIGNRELKARLAELTG